MNYIEVAFSISPFEPWADILASELGDVGFDSFVEENGVLLGYIPENVFDEAAMKTVESFDNDLVKIDYTFREMEQENWNQKWESNFEPVFVDDEICVRATFHPDFPEYPYQIIIDPKMSFGTGHHSTTHLMLSTMKSMDFENKSVLDMGSGTGVLAIFAAMKGATPVYAIDIDEWCSINAQENVERNNLKGIHISQGGKEKIAGMKVDVILANINRNILLDQIEEYANALPKNGILIMSGFYDADVDILLEEAKKNEFEFVSKQLRNEWANLVLRKK
jgi:ribosomal protein L11 methyltransferase